MTETILANEPEIRLVFFLGIFALMVLWEFVTPRRERFVSRWVRWPSNLGIVVFNTLILRILVPMAAVGLALLSEERGWGLLNATMPRLLGQRTQRDTDCSLRGVTNSQRTMRAKIPRKKTRRISGSFAKIVSVMVPAFEPSFRTGASIPTGTN